jgi:hypothetical protein
MGISSGRLTVKEVDIHDNVEHGMRNEGGVEVGKEPRVKLSKVTVQNNGSTGIFIFHGLLTGSDLTVTDNDLLGISGLTQFKLKRTTVQNNGRDGLHAPYGGGRLTDSLLSFNGTPGIDVDLRTQELPILKNTQCGFSADDTSGMPWGVCAGD